MKKEKSKDDKSKKSKKDEDKKSEKAPSKSKSKEKDNSKEKSNSKGKEGSKTPKKESKPKKQTDKQSQISSISQTPMPPADCIHHKSPFINFCQTCEELVCNQCTVFGPHNNHLHRILKMTDAYRLRKFYLVQAIRSNLVDKRDKIIAQLHRLQYRVQQIRFVKNIIQRDIRSEYSGILERLKNYEGVKLATLTHEVSLVQRQLDTINDLGNSFFELTNMQCEKIEQQRKMNKFLVKSKEMYDNIEYITNKPDRVAPDLALHEMPREVEKNRDLVKKALAGREINSFKNEILWKLVTDIQAQKNGVRKDLEEQANKVIKDLSQEVEDLNGKLIKYRLKCFFCGAGMHPDTVNKQCSFNSEKGVKINWQAPTRSGPREDQIGNKRHFFTQLITE